MDVAMSRGRRTVDHSQAVMTAALVTAVTIYVAAFARAMQTRSYDVWGAFLVGPVLLAVSLPILRRYSRRVGEASLARLLAVALVAKLLASVVRYYVAFSVYGGVADASNYSANGRQLADGFRHLDFTMLGLDGSSVVGTRFIDIVTGIVYAIIGPSLIGAYLVFSWLGFWGLFFFYRAFRTAVPDGDAKRYALLVFFLPSLLFWPSGLGKDAWITLALGLAAYGGALLLTRNRGGWLCLGLGMAGILAVRPHVAILVVASLAVAYLLRGLRGAGDVRLGRLRTAVGLVAIGAGFLFVFSQASKFLGLDKVDSESLNQQFQSVQRHTAEGGSAFHNAGGPSLTHMPINVITVLFRPFPVEAHNAQMLIAAAEGSLLLVLTAVLLPRLRLARLRRQPYLVACLAYILAFCFAFSTFNNFGILTRERVMVLPFLLALLSLRSVRPTASLGLPAPAELVSRPR